uniref:Outer dense fiber protein 3-like n=1 Tax=Sphaeramia orbicularis TaxID=375764 RepID=A0A673AGV0_9TELE
MTSADPWVGTWRPHRPKGPIAALHGSPGPAYALPGLTGKTITTFSAPKVLTPFTFATGPGSYNLPTALGCKTVVTSAAPAHSISSRSKIGGFNEDLKKSPGPAAYKVVDSCIFKSKPPQYSMTGRNFTPSPGANTPGPGSHNPGKVTFTKAKAPCFSFGLRHSEYILPVPNVAE